jgi:hypothetical protein
MKSLNVSVEVMDTTLSSPAAAFSASVRHRTMFHARFLFFSLTIVLQAAVSRNSAASRHSTIASLRVSFHFYTSPPRRSVSPSLDFDN